MLTAGLADVKRELTACFVVRLLCSISLEYGGRLLAFDQFTNTSVAPSLSTWPHLLHMNLVLTASRCYQRYTQLCAHWFTETDANGRPHESQPQLQNFAYHTPHKFAYCSECCGGSRSGSSLREATRKP